MRIKNTDDLQRHLNELLAAREGLMQQMPKMTPEARWELTAAIAELDGYIVIRSPTDVVN